MKQLRVLAVKDREEAEHLLEDTVTRCGHRVVGVVKADESLVEQITELQPDIILLDISTMKTGPGIDAVRSITSRYQIPLLLVTDAVDATVPDFLESIDAAGCLVKPIGEPELRVAMDAAIRYQAALNDG
ncbi:MAG: response regulator [Deltaproteobacteria bacterium]|nr:response regulator [Deltaproteobacteria bacterium]